MNKKTKKVRKTDTKIFMTNFRKHFNYAKKHNLIKDIESFRCRIWGLDDCCIYPFMYNVDTKGKFFERFHKSYTWNSLNFARLSKYIRSDMMRATFPQDPGFQD